MKEYAYVIESTTEKDEFGDGGPLYWCNDDGFGWSGWGHLDTATRFTGEEKRYLQLPCNSQWKYAKAGKAAA